MEINNSGSQVCCPVCTLFLREGMTLQDHLFTHPKDQVIEALVRISSSTIPLGSSSQYTAITYQHYRTSMSNGSNSIEPNVAPVPLMLNSCIIPQQFVSSSPPSSPISRNSYQSNVIRSPVSILPYSFYSQQHPNYINGNSQNHDSFANNNIESVHYSGSGNITQTTQTPNSPFDEDLADEIHNKNDNENEENIDEIQPTSDPFSDDRQGSQFDSVENNEDEKQEDEMNDCQSFTTHNNIGTVISNTHRLITNDPTLTYDHNNRSDNVEFSNVHIIYSTSPRDDVISPVSSSSSWSSSGLRVRKDLNNSPVVQVSNTLVAHENDYITDDCEFINESGNRSESHLLNLDNVSASRGFAVQTGLETIKECDNLENKEEEEEHSEQGVLINIHSDELMPPRGELSGQESLGATENSVWELEAHEEGSQEGTPSYSSINNEKWNIELSPKKKMIQSVQTATITKPKHKCLNCEQLFDSLKDRRSHIRSEHKPEKKKNVITTNVVKKEETVISQSTNKFVQVFVKEETSGLKTEVESRTCQECKVEFPSIKEFRRHRKSVHIETEKRPLRQCTTCNDCFPNSKSFKEHIAKVHPLECIDCGKCFQNRGNLNLHQKRHLKIRPFHCTVCDKSFTTKQKLLEHENGHSGNRPFKCNLCERTFMRYSNLIQHRNFHHLKIKRKVKDYFCHCGEVFHSVKKLEWHKEIHDPKPKQCLYCNQKFVHSASLTRHIRHNHDNAYLPNKGNKLENVQCIICHQQYLKSSMAMHMRTHTGVKPYSCTTCCKEFSTKWNLQLHKWTHASRNSKPFKCKLCQSAFVSNTDYQAHMRSHKNIRPYICNYCGRQFIRKYNCIRHVKEHEVTKSYVCQECGKSFHRSYYLTEHMRMHTGFKPFACHICAKRSSTKSNHNKHIKTHHAREPVNTEG
uniref:C2H2-type domain-containing protein n=1 Tax=Clastoptera arizonana TaxID=38151 RepID=A0A1B6DDE6_9HEMI